MRAGERSLSTPLHGPAQTKGPILFLSRPLHLNHSRNHWNCKPKNIFLFPFYFFIFLNIFIFYLFLFTHPCFVTARHRFRLSTHDFAKGHWVSIVPLLTLPPRHHARLSLYFNPKGLAHRDHLQAHLPSLGSPRIWTQPRSRVFHVPYFPPQITQSSHPGFPVLFVLLWPSSKPAWITGKTSKADRETLTSKSRAPCYQPAALVPVFTATSPSGQSSGGKWCRLDSPR
ncbi:hypothetical protein VUR80DRAFT_5734 [Thermomyces stellatus]